MEKCVFLDRDGVINMDSPDYVYQPEKFRLIPGAVEAINLFKKKGFLVIVVTNQSGIAQGIYARKDMHACHEVLLQHVNHQIDHIYYAPYHDTISRSLSRKPGSLMFERAIARFNIDINHSWMVGDRERDILPALQLGMKTIQVGEKNDQVAHYFEKDLINAAKIILKS